MSKQCSPVPASSSASSKGYPSPLAECCPPLMARPLDADRAAAIAPFFKALGDPVRLRLVSMIASSAEICVCDLTGEFDVSGPTISHHLRVLREVGLVECQRRGTWVYYRIRSDALRLLGGLFRTPVSRD